MLLLRTGQNSAAWQGGLEGGEEGWGTKVVVGEVLVETEEGTHSCSNQLGWGRGECKSLAETGQGRGRWKRLGLGGGHGCWISGRLRDPLRLTSSSLNLLHINNNRGRETLGGAEIEVTGKG